MSITTKAIKRCFPVALIVSIVAVLSLVRALYATLLPQFSAALSLGDLQKGGALWALGLGYFAMVIPAAMVMRNFGYKSGIVLGLSLYALGMFLFHPAAERPEYLFLVAAAMVVGGGLSVIEAAVNALVMRLGPVEGAVRRLNFAQALAPVGILTGVLIGQSIITQVGRSLGPQLAHALVRPIFLIGVGVLLFAYLFDNAKLPAVAEERVAKDDATITDVFVVMRSRAFVRGAGILLLGIVAGTMLLSLTIPYSYAAIRGMSPSMAESVILCAIGAFLVGRIVGSGLMFLWNPSCVLAAFSASGFLVVAFAVIWSGQLGIWCVVAASFFISIVYPTLFGNAIRDLGPHTKSGSAVLMLTVGIGAMVEGLGKLIPLGIVRYAMIVPGVSLALIAAFAVAFYRNDVLTTARRNRRRVEVPLSSVRASNY